MTRNNNYPAPGINPAILDCLRAIHPAHARRIDTYIEHLQDLKASGKTFRQVNQSIWMQAFIAAYWFCHEGVTTDEELAKPLVVMAQDLTPPEVSA